MELVSPSQMREIDRVAIDEFGIPGVVLMERASLGAVEHLVGTAPMALDRVALVCGGGNNGGDGLAMARLLHERGIDVTIALLSHPRDDSDAGINLRICHNLELDIVDLSDDDGPSAVQKLKAIEPADVWCDALFGTGLDRPIAGRYRDVVEWLSGRDWVFGVDIASGIDAATGQVLGCATSCFATATFALPKLGQAVEPGRTACGALQVVDIGIPHAVFDRFDDEPPTTATWLTADQFRFAARPADMHKGDAGRVVVIGGATGTTGAAIMAGRAALRSGAGLVTIAAPAQAAMAIHAAAPQIMASDWESDALSDLLGSADVVVCGPGMGQTASAIAALEQALASNASLVLDADALNLIASGRVELPQRDAPTVLTPHPGEASRLLGDPVTELLAAPYATALRIAERFKAHAVFKTSSAIVSSVDGDLAVNASGNPGMATGGMGDALCGIIAARLCENDDPFAAICEAVFAHGMAGDIGSERVSTRGLTVDDLIEGLTQVWRFLESR